MTYIRKSNIERRSGAVALPLVIGLTVLITSVGIAISVLGSNEVQNSLRSSDSDKALLYAESGVKDAIQRMKFNKNYDETTGYEIDFSDDDSTCGTPADGCATVKIYNKIGGTTLSPSVIVSEGEYKDSVRTLNVAAITTTDSSGRLVNTLYNEVKNLPIPFTAQATSITSSGATLNGWINPNSNSATAWFRYSDADPDPAPTVCDDSGGSSLPNRAPSGSGGTAASGTTLTSFDEVITGLTSQKTYYFCAIADDGNGNEVYGALYVFTTL